MAIKTIISSSSLLCCFAVMAMLITILLSVKVSSQKMSREELQEKCSKLDVPISETDVTVAVFKNSNRSYWERPIKNATSSIGIVIFLSINTIIDIDEKAQVVVLNGYMFMNWTDEFHSWDTIFPLNCLDSLVLPHGPESGVWLPDVVFTSSTDRYDVTQSPHEYLRIFSNGAINISPGGEFRFHCAFDLSLFPFDTQSCLMRFESWRYPSRYQHYESASIYIDRAYSEDHAQWNIVSASVKTKVRTYQSGESYNEAHFTVIFKRKFGYYMLTVILPVLLIAAVEMFTFAMPYDKGVRLEVSVTCLLAFSMFQSVITNDMPKSADNPPLLLILICLLTFYIGVAIFVQAISIYLIGKGDRCEHVPGCLLKMVSFLAPLIMMPRFEEEMKQRKAIKQQLNNNHVSSHHSFDPITPNGDEIDPCESWRYIARVTDRYGFWLFTFLLLFTTVGFLLLVPAIKQQNVS